MNYPKGTVRRLARPEGQPVKKPSKYRNVKTTVDDRVFDSKREADRYSELKLMERAGVIRSLVLQPVFPLWAHTGVVAHEPVEIGSYRGDFGFEESYTVNGDLHWRDVVEDCKGFRTPLYRWKKKHVEAQYQIQIRET